MTKKTATRLESLSGKLDIFSIVAAIAISLIALAFKLSTVEPEVEETYQEDESYE